MTTKMDYVEYTFAMQKELKQIIKVLGLKLKNKPHGLEGRKWTHRVNWHFDFVKTDLPSSKKLSETPCFNKRKVEEALPYRFLNGGKNGGTKFL